MHTTGPGLCTRCTSDFTHPTLRTTASPYIPAHSSSTVLGTVACMCAPVSAFASPSLSRYRLSQSARCSAQPVRTALSAIVFYSRTAVGLTRLASAASRAFWLVVLEKSWVCVQNIVAIAIWTRHPCLKTSQLFPRVTLHNRVWACGCGDRPPWFHAGASSEVVPPSELWRCSSRSRRDSRQAASKTDSPTYGPRHRTSNKERSGVLTLDTRGRLPALGSGSSLCSDERG
jgi:hypothetical protein